MAICRCLLPFPLFFKDFKDDDGHYWDENGIPSDENGIPSVISVIPSTHPIRKYGFLSYSMELQQKIVGKPLMEGPLFFLASENTILPCHFQLYINGFSFKITKTTTEEISNQSGEGSNDQKMKGSLPKMGDEFSLVFSPFTLVRNCRFESEKSGIDFEKYKLFKISLFGMNICYYFGIKVPDATNTPSNIQPPAVTAAVSGPLSTTAGGIVFGAAITGSGILRKESTRNQITMGPDLSPDLSINPSPEDRPPSNLKRSPTTYSQDDPRHSTYSPSSMRSISYDSNIDCNHDGAQQRSYKISGSKFKTKNSTVSFSPKDTPGTIVSYGDLDGPFNGPLYSNYRRLGHKVYQFTSLTGKSPFASINSPERKLSIQKRLSRKVEEKRQAWVLACSKCIRSVSESLFPTYGSAYSSGSTSTSVYNYGTGGGMGAYLGSLRATLDSIRVDPLVDKPTTRTRIMAGYLLYMYPSIKSIISIVYGELHSHRSENRQANLLLYQNDECDIVLTEIAITEDTSCYEKVGINSSAFCIEHSHNFVAKTIVERKLWTRAIGNLKVKLQNFAQTPDIKELRSYRIAIKQHLAEIKENLRQEEGMLRTKEEKPNNTTKQQHSEEEKDESCSYYIMDPLLERSDRQPLEFFGFKLRH